MRNPDNSNGAKSESLRVFVFNVVIRLVKNEWADLCESFRTARAARISRRHGQRRKPLPVIALRRESDNNSPYGSTPSAMQPKRVGRVVPGPGLREATPFKDFAGPSTSVDAPVDYTSCDGPVDYTSCDGPV